MNKQMIISLTASVLLASAHTQAIEIPSSPNDLVTMINSDEYKTDLSYRKMVRAVSDHVLDEEKDASNKPYTSAIQQNLIAQLDGDTGDALRGRISHLLATSYKASLIEEPIDVYLLMGQSNMVGLTETGSYNGPDEEIKAKLQNVTEGRTVVTVNCAIGATAMYSWDPATVSSKLMFPSGYLQHNITRECIESARNIKNALGQPSQIKGAFYYQGEADVTLKIGLNNLFGTDDMNYTYWAEGYARVVDLLRTEFGQIPVVHAKIAPSISEDQNVKEHTEALRTVQLGISLPKTGFITTDDLTVFDGIHLDDESQTKAGNRFGDKMIELL